MRFSDSSGRLSRGETLHLECQAIDQYCVAWGTLVTMGGALAETGPWRCLALRGTQLRAAARCCYPWPLISCLPGMAGICYPPLRSRRRLPPQRLLNLKGVTLKSTISALTVILAALAPAALSASRVYCTATHPAHDESFYGVKIPDSALNMAVVYCTRWAEANAQDPQECKLVECSPVL